MLKITVPFCPKVVRNNLIPKEKNLLPHSINILSRILSSCQVVNDTMLTNDKLPVVRPRRTHPAASRLWRFFLCRQMRNRVINAA